MRLELTDGEESWLSESAEKRQGTGGEGRVSGSAGGGERERAREVGSMRKAAERTRSRTWKRFSIGRMTTKAGLSCHTASLPWLALMYTGSLLSTLGLSVFMSEKTTGTASGRIGACGSEGCGLRRARRDLEVGLWRTQASSRAHSPETFTAQRSPGLQTKGVGENIARGA